ncbi:hypothetical protein [Ruicaihuangia caeni]|uniref:Uncharacterized protein n=1 Tax=Ruicaihuangia caeni TaxID=3042517 RepID=A0AAW6T2H2_9MICO|nr:hypothetical protein [Klugiella sp. YN-L-19]MDI2098001.1 hypothetical protein [Klugiella sp. YN-L-19]
MRTTVDARFAGGPIFVDTGELSHAPEQTIVSVDVPGYAFQMFPHEARALADALRAAADHADAPKVLRRPQQIDDELRALDE